MPIDTSIYNNLQPVRIDSPLNTLAKVSQVQNAQNQNRLANLAIQQHQISLDQTNALNRAYQGALNPDGTIDQGKLFSGIANSGYGSQLPAVQKGLLEVQASMANIGKTKAETAAKLQETAQHQFELSGQLAGSWAMDPNVNKQKIVAGINAALHSGIIPPQTAQAKLDELQTVGDDPASLQQWSKGVLAQVTKESMRFIAPDANAQLAARTSAANNAATNATSRANNAANIGKDYAINGMNSDGSPTDSVESMAQGIANGKIAPLTGFSLARPRGQAIMARVMQLNPNYDAGDYAAKNAALKSFSTGKEGAMLRSFNVATDHLDTLSNMADALNNGNIQALNKVSNMWKQQTGNPAPTDFNSVKEIVGKEVTKAIVAGGGGVGEREELAKLLDSANSPAQLKGVISHFKELMDAQRAGLIDQYQRTTGRTDGATVFAPSKPAAPAAPAIPAGWTVQEH